MPIPETLHQDGGVLSYSGAVKRWECDRNDHWNVGFYVRGFQMASEVLAAMATGTNPGVAVSAARLYRFHRELFCPEPMNILSSRLAHGPCAGGVVHRMLGGADQRLAATAFEMPAYPVQDLPVCAPEEAAKAMPRNLSAESRPWITRPVAADGSGLPSTIIGVVQASDVDHTGQLLPSALIQMCSGASFNFMDSLGLTAEWINRTNCNRMAVEMQVGWRGHCVAGDVLQVSTWMSEVGGRHFAMYHQVWNAVTGEPCATIERAMLVVDLAKRRAVELPDFIRTASRRLALASQE